MIDASVIRDLWDFDDPAGSHARFAAASRDETRSASDRAELATQVARALGLQGEFVDGEAVLDGIDGPADVVRARVLLERGRLRRSAGQVAASVPLFAAAGRVAAEAGAEALVVDAFHMLALADPERATRWTRQGLTIAEASADPETRRWRVALRNNLGWSLHDDGQLAAALEEFRLAHEASVEVRAAEQEQIARWTIARCLRSLGRTSEALEMQRVLRTERPEDRYVLEEIEILEG